MTYNHPLQLQNLYLQGTLPTDVEMHGDENLNMESGDILLTKDQALALLEEAKAEERRIKGSSGRTKRRAIVPSSKRWNLPIRYMFDTSHGKTFQMVLADFLSVVDTNELIR